MKAKTFKSAVAAVLSITSILLLSGCRDYEALATERLNNAIADVDVIVRGQEFRWGDFHDGRSIEERIDVSIDFKRHLRKAEVEYSDFVRARGNHSIFVDDLYGFMDALFNRTNILTLTVNNVDYLANFDTEGLDLDFSRIPVHLGLFALSPDNRLRIYSHYGNLRVNSDFFYELPGFTDDGVAATTDRYLIFSYDSNEEFTTIWLNIEEQGRIRRRVENPRSSIHIAIPLASEVMGGRNYDAVIFIDHEGAVQDILPRSFIADDYLHILFNRVGGFRLTSTENGNTTNITAFLRDRGISLNGREYNGQRIVNRGEFYYALMRIHWAEALNFARHNPLPPDVHGGGNLELKIWAGYNLRINIGSYYSYVLQGFPDGRFRHDDPLVRSHLYIMLAGNIEYFKFEVNRKMPVDTNALGVPYDSGLYWYRHFRYLEDIGFVPYLSIDGAVDVAPNSFVTVQEAEDILFHLITARP